MKSRRSEINTIGNFKAATEFDDNKLKVMKKSVVDGDTVKSACFNAPVDCSDETSHNIFEQVLEIPTFRFKGLLNKSQISKECRKLDKKKQADEKKRQREEEYRRKLLPRDQKVTLIDRNVLDSLEKFSEMFSNTPRKYSNNSLQRDHDDFPALGATCSKPNRGETEKSSFKEHTNCEDLGSRHSMVPGQNCEPVAGASIEHQRDKATSSKRAHWRNAVKIDLIDIAKGAGSLKREEDRKKQTTRVQKHSKQTLCGNPLDSSNPERKRGKFRENKKAKISSLKRIIRDELEKRKREKAELDQRYQKVEDKDTFSDSKQDCSSSFPEVSTQNSGSSEHNISYIAGVEKTTQQDSLDSETTALVVSVDKEKEGDKKTSTQNILSESSLTIVNGDTTEVKPKCMLHSRKFREYCDHFVTPEINELTSNVIRELLRLQDRQYQRDPVKAHNKRKYVVGLHETKKFLLLKKVKLLIIATDIEKIESAGGLNDLISQLKETAAAQNVPCVFALQRRKIGYLTLKKSPVSCLGVMNYQACESHVTALLEAVMVARQQYNDASQSCGESINQNELLESKSAVHGKTDEAVKEIIDSFISLVRCETSTEGNNYSSPFLQAIERINK